MPTSEYYKQGLKLKARDPEMFRKYYAGTWGKDGRLNCQIIGVTAAIKAAKAKHPSPYAKNQAPKMSKLCKTCGKSFDRPKKLSFRDWNARLCCTRSCSAINRCQNETMPNLPNARKGKSE